MRELVFLLEEESAKSMLESLLPRILHADIQLRYIPFEGKQDLERQMVRRLRGYVNPHARFIILRDQDSTSDCKELKARLVQRCEQAGQAAKSAVRIACRELESFYLADLRAVEQALGLDKLARLQGSAKYRYPDRLGSPSRELEGLTGGMYQKRSGSRAIGRHLDPDNERSPSFKNFIKSVRRMEGELLTIPNTEEL